MLVPLEYLHSPDWEIIECVDWNGGEIVVVQKQRVWDDWAIGEDVSLQWGHPVPVQMSAK